jgi:hypothetical protein
MKRFPDIPFVWHFKEGPSFCLNKDKATWDKLIELYKHADGAIFLNEEARAYYECFLPESRPRKPFLIFDAEKANREYFTNNFSEKLSARDGEPHTLIAGRAIGIGLNELENIVAQGIHLHYHCHISDSHAERRIRIFERKYQDYVHLHPFVNPREWVGVFSRYDAGWLHVFESHNGGLPYDMSWDDLNLPARISPLVAAGLPWILRDNRGHAVAMQSLAEEKEIGVFYDTLEDLSEKLHDRALIKRLGDNVLRHRESFSFDHHVPRLVNFFREVITP